MAKSDDKSLPDQAIEAIVYAPIGIAYEILDRLPTWVARGKSQATITKVLGKMAVQKGQSEFEDVVSDIFGTKPAKGAPEAQNSAEKIQTAPKASTATKSSTSGSKGPSSPAATTSKNSSSTSNPAKPAKAAKDAGASKKSASVKKTPTAKRSKTAKAAKTAKPGKTPKPGKTAKAAKPSKVSKATKPATDGPVAESDLALASYGSMPASQIVKRLNSLSAEQVEDVRSFEEANRRRVTVLNRIRQIQAAS